MRPTREQYQQTLPYEDGVVWLVPIDRLPYVRETILMVTRRKGKPGRTFRRLIGYTTLRDDAPPALPRRYYRRFFWMATYDPHGRTPIEAVDPRTVVAGHTSLQPRSSFLDDEPPRIDLTPRRRRAA